MSRWMLFLALTPLGLAPTGCLDDPGFTCQSNAVCFVEGVSGECDVATNRCVYPTADCPTLYRDGEGNCVSAPTTEGGSSMSSTAGTASATTSDASTTASSNSDSDSNATTDDSSEDTRDTADETTSTDPTIDPTTDPTTSDDESSSGVADCSTLLDNITSEGVVNASTVFNGYPPVEAVDGDLSSSWFSTGPEGGGAPSVYTWTSGVDRCISRIFIADNAANANPDFQSGFGFDRATVRVVALNNDTKYEETFELPGTPDGDITADTEGVIGNRIIIELYDHENSSCGGFAELQVLGGTVPFE